MTRLESNQFSAAWLLGTSNKRNRCKGTGLSTRQTTNPARSKSLSYALRAMFWEKDE